MAKNDLFVRRLGRGLLGVGVCVMTLGLAFTHGSFAAPNWDPNDNATLQASQRGSSNPGFGTGTCPAPPEGAPGDWGWHFVLPGSTTSFVTIDVDFATYGFHQHVPFVATPSAKHAYVYTPGPDTLNDARAVVNGTETTFVLSHVCTGTTGTTTTTTTSTVPDSTTTEPETTTTTVPDTTTTTEPETTTTTEPETTTTTEPETTTTTVPETTTTTVPDTTTSTTTTTTTTTTSTTTTTVPETTTTTEPETTTTTVPDTTTTTAQVSPSSVVPPTTEATTTTAGAQPGATVLGEQILRDDQLPRTGADSGWLITVGLALVLAGLVFVAHGRLRMGPES